jgi:hypothetical protein
MDDIKTKIDEGRQKLAPYADGVIDRVVVSIVAHPKATLSVLAALFILFLVAANH